VVEEGFRFCRRREDIMAIDGRWKVTLNTPMGAREAILELVTEGTLLKGRWSGPQGTQEFAGGTVEGNSLAWQVEVSGPMGTMTLRFTGTVEGDKLTGNVQFGSFGSGTFSGVRS
jgi:hypothetical protein